MRSGVKGGAPRPAVGSLSMKTGETRAYVLTFRCINCGRHDVFAHCPLNTSRLKTESVSAYTMLRAIRAVGVAMFVVFRPFVFRMRESLKRRLRDRDSVCDAAGLKRELKGLVICEQHLVGFVPKALNLPKSMR